MGQLYNIPLGHHFLETLARGVLAQYGGDPFALSRVQILLPTRRACQDIKTCFYDLQGGRSLMLPRISPLGEVGSEPNPFLYPDLPPQGNYRVIPPLIRQGLLLQLVERFQRDSLKGELPKSLSLKLTRDLISLIDQAHIERVPLERLHDIVPDTFAHHWQITLDFLKILFEAWPQILSENNYVEPYALHWESTDHLVAFWKSSPPQTPLIAAGSTGTMPATRLLLKSILSLETGQVVLPGYDTSLPPEHEVESSHPQFSLRRLAHVLDAPIVPWPWIVPLTESTQARATFFSDPSEAALKDCTLIEGKTLAEEALTIALILREVLETPQKTAVVITADQELLLRISAELERWGIALPLTVSLRTESAGILVGLLGEIVRSPLDPISLLGVLKHQHLKLGWSPAILEQKILRTLQREWSWYNLKESVAQKLPDLLEKVEILENHLKPLLQSSSEILSLETWTEKLEDVLRSLIPDISQDVAFQKLLSFLGRVKEASFGFAPLSLSEYFEILEDLMAEVGAKALTLQPSRIEILGVLEARFIKRDLMILAGLNEGSWPPETLEDPWLSRPMRAAMDFPSPERRIGLSAHDFSSAFASPHVILTRSLKKGGAPTVPSRFLSRLDVAVRREGWAIPKETSYKKLIDHLHSAQETVKLVPTSPTPPLEARPTTFYVTHVETLRRDPYAYYAKHILKLKPLDPIAYPPRPSDRGNLFHQILERAFRDRVDLTSPTAFETLCHIAQEEFDQLPLDTTTRLFWWNRFLRCGAWFLHQEQEVRARSPHLKTFVEIEGDITVKTDRRTYRLKAKADRLDLYPEGRVTVIDYKTGTPPTQEDVVLGFSPQLPLEAALIQRGGFVEFGVRESLSLAFWWLKGVGSGGEVREIKGDASLLAQEAYDGFVTLLQFYEDPQVGYHAAPVPEKELAYNDYEGVSRVREWRRR